MRVVYVLYKITHSYNILSTYFNAHIFYYIIDFDKLCIGTSVLEIGYLIVFINHFVVQVRQSLKQTNDNHES